MTTRLAAYATAAFLMLLCSGCGSAPSPSNAAGQNVATAVEGPHRAIVVFVDASTSIATRPEGKRTAWQTAMKNQMEVIWTLVARDLPQDGKTWVEIYIMGNKQVREKYKDLVVRKEVLLPALKRIIDDGPIEAQPNPDPKQKPGGTWFSPAIGILSQRAQRIGQRFPNCPTVALFLTDGGVDDMEPSVKMGAVAFPLTSSIQYIHAAPVKDTERAKLAKVFKPWSDAQRFDCSSTLDMGEGRRRLVEVLTKSPAAAGSSNAEKLGL